MPAGINGNYLHEAWGARKRTLAYVMTAQPTVAPEVETANADYVVDGDVGIIGAVDFGDGVDVAQAFFQGVEFGGRDEVGPEALSRWLARTPMTVLGMNSPDRGFPALRGAHRNF